MILISFLNPSQLLQVIFDSSSSSQHASFPLCRLTQIYSLFSSCTCSCALHRQWMSEGQFNRTNAADLKRSVLRVCECIIADECVLTFGSVHTWWCCWSLWLTAHRWNWGIQCHTAGGCLPFSCEMTLKGNYCHIRWKRITCVWVCSSVTGRLRLCEDVTKMPHSAANRPLDLKNNELLMFNVR